MSRRPVSEDIGISWRTYARQTSLDSAKGLYKVLKNRVKHGALNSDFDDPSNRIGEKTILNYIGKLELLLRKKYQVTFKRRLAVDAITGPRSYADPQFTSDGKKDGVQQLILKLYAIIMLNRNERKLDDKIEEIAIKEEQNDSDWEDSD